MKKISKANGCVVVAWALILATTPVGDAAETIVGRTWSAAEQVSIDKIDHAAWDGLLQKYVDGQGDVDYTGWKASAENVQRLDEYLAALSQADVRKAASHDAKLAFFINAYNAVTIQGILREYPTTTIRNHTAKVFGYNIWQDLLLQVGNQRYSLEAMEHEVLRKMKEPRIHFAIVCASIGCPRLQNRAFTADAVDDQLAAAARGFFADAKHLRVDATKKTVQLSQIFKWFGEDFGATQQKRLTWIADYVDDAPAKELLRGGRATVSYLDYDWDLNDQNTASSRQQ